MKMHRIITSNDVIDYAVHIPGDDMVLDKEEDVEYKDGVLTHAAGTVDIQLMPEVRAKIIIIL